jgi:hypothetical protein
MYRRIGSDCRIGGGSTAAVGSKLRKIGSSSGNRTGSGAWRAPVWDSDHEADGVTEGQGVRVSSGSS